MVIGSVFILNTPNLNSYVKYWTGKKMAPHSNLTRIGLAGLAVIRQNLALNIAEKAMAEFGLLYHGMWVLGGEEGAWNGPSLMPGWSFEAFKNIEDILLKVAEQVLDNGHCLTYIGKGGFIAVILASVLKWTWSFIVVILT